MKSTWQNGTGDRTDCEIGLEAPFSLPRDDDDDDDDDPSREGRPTRHAFSQ